MLYYVEKQLFLAEQENKAEITYNINKYWMQQHRSFDPEEISDIITCTFMR